MGPKSLERIEDIVRTSLGYIISSSLIESKKNYVGSETAPYIN